MRRAAVQGLVHGKRTSARRFETSLREEAYLREYWPLLTELRAALRTEPSVRLAVLFGSLATGRGHKRSDLDLLVSLSDSSAGQVAQVTARLERRVARPVQLVRLEDAENVPLLMLEAVEHGRVLIDRDGEWPRLRSRLAILRRRVAKADAPLLEAMQSLDVETSG